MNARKSLVKVFGPVLLLTASLALPVDTMAAPANGKQAAHAEKDRKERKNKGGRAQARGQQRQKRQQAQERRGTQQRRQQGARQRQVQSQRQNARAQERRVQSQRQKSKASQRRVQSQRQERVKLQQQRQARVERQQRVQLQQQRQARIERQRQLELQRQAELRRQAQVRQQNAYRYDNRNRTRYDNRYDRNRSGVRRGGGGADPSIFHIDGYLTDEGYECQALRGHDGRVWMLVGNTYGLRSGDHVRLYGRTADGGSCGWQGTAFDIYEVRTVWADDRHRTTYYDHLTDGAFDRAGYDQYADPYNDGYDDRYDDTYDDYDNRDDRWYDGILNGGGNRRLISREGRLEQSRGCTYLRSGDRTYGLSGSLRNYRPGDNVKVTGFLEGRDRCGAEGLQVREITRD